MSKKIKVTFDKKHCFACGARLDKRNYSEEHIYPKWLQTKFNLREEKLLLLNNTEIKYKRLKIQCCKNCNQRFNQKIEAPINYALKENSFENFCNLDELIIIQWINKIKYGILYKENSLLSKPKIDGYPWSIFIFKVDSSNDCFNFIDFPFINNASLIQLGNIAVISCLGDGGRVKKSLDSYKNKIGTNSLSEIQLKEFFVFFISKLISFKNDPTFITCRNIKSNKITNIITTNLSYSYEDITIGDYVSMMKLVKIPINDSNLSLNFKNRKYKGETFYLFDENGNFIKTK